MSNTKEPPENQPSLWAEWIEEQERIRKVQEQVHQWWLVYGPPIKKTKKE